MKSLLFNSHDIVLALIIVLCFLLAFRARAESALPRIAQNYLATFFVLYALIALDTLLFWGEGIKFAAFNVSPWLPMVFSFASFAIGPIFYWTFRSLLFAEKSIQVADFWQLAPALATFPYLFWSCYRYPPEQQADLILNLTIFSQSSAYFMAFLTLKKLMPLIYGIACVGLLLQHRHASDEAARAARHFLQPYTGFVLIWLWVLSTHLLGQWLPLASSDMLGIFGNYMSLTLIAAMIFRDGTHTEAMPAAAERKTLESPVVQTGQRGEETDRYFEENQYLASNNAEVDHEEYAALAERIHKFVETEKPFLNSRLTLERFSALLQVSPRQVSLAINRCFQQNFHEYINAYRVEEAKRLLRDDDGQHYGILEIAQHSGFNSKATFNRIFKNVAGVTPTEYRRQCPTELATQGPQF